MHCEKCGNIVSKTGNYCGKCGFNIEISRKSFINKLRMNNIYHIDENKKFYYTYTLLFSTKGYLKIKNHCIFLDNPIYGKISCIYPKDVKEVYIKNINIIYVNFCNFQDMAGCLKIYVNDNQEMELLEEYLNKKYVNDDETVILYDDIMKKLCKECLKEGLKKIEIEADRNKLFDIAKSFGINDNEIALVMFEEGIKEEIVNEEEKIQKEKVKLKKEQQKKRDEEVRIFVKECLIDNGGNKFTTIKMVKEKYNYNIDSATQIVNKVFEEFDSPKPKSSNVSVVHKGGCPHCGFSNYHKLSTARKVVSTEMFGLASSTIGKTYVCDKCGYKW